MERVLHGERDVHGGLRQLLQRRRPLGERGGRKGVEHGAGRSVQTNGLNIEEVIVMTDEAKGTAFLRGRRRHFIGHVHRLHESAYDFILLCLH